MRLVERRTGWWDARRSWIEICLVALVTAAGAIAGAHAAGADGTGDPDPGDPDGESIEAVLTFVAGAAGFVAACLVVALVELALVVLRRRAAR